MSRAIERAKEKSFYVSSASTPVGTQQKLHTVPWYM